MKKVKQKQAAPLKTVQIHKPAPKLTPEQTVQFLEDFAKVVHGKDAPTKLISLRVPENILNTFKFHCQKSHQKYQSIIVQLMREYVAKNG